MCVCVCESVCVCVCKRSLTVFKVELVEVHALHQVPQSLGFKRGESRITNPPERAARQKGSRVRRYEWVRRRYIETN